MKSNINFKRIFLIFSLFLISAIAYQIPLSLDVTANKINSLSESNRTLLSTLDKPLTIDLYSANQHVTEQIQTILSLFQKESMHIVLNLHHKPLDMLDKTRLLTVIAKKPLILILKNGMNTHLAISYNI
jgi:hypothetical protein